MADDSKGAEKKGGSKLIIILLLLIILAGGGAAVYFLVIKKPAEETTVVNNENNSQQYTHNAGKGNEPGPMHTYPPFLVNLADPGGNRYLRVTISLELSKDKNFPAELAAKEPLVMDTIITILASKKFDEVNNTQGKGALKQELMRKLNSLFTSGRITAVYITEFVVQ